MNLRSAVVLAGLGIAIAGCSDDEDEFWGWGGGGAPDAGGASGSPSGGAAGQGTGGSAGAAAGAAGSPSGGSGGGETGGSGGAETGGSGGSSTDPYAAAREVCIATINQYRATKGLPPYERWTSAEACVDEQATSDEQSGSGHGAFGQCGESGQNECLGGGAAGIESCLAMMWAEGEQAGCAGCDACADGYNPDCPNCDFYGSETGDVCGHYVNMSAKYFSRAACGFSDLGGWAAIDFQ